MTVLCVNRESIEVASASFGAHRFSRSYWRSSQAIAASQVVLRAELDR